jgi:hypothetical protein
LCVDHDHVTGHIRRLICAACNTGLGFFRESAELLRMAHEYLEECAADAAAGIAQAVPQSHD